MQKTVIIFDIDGTLLFSNKIDSECFAETYQTIYQKPFPTIDWTYFPAVSDTVIFETVIQEQFGRVPDEVEVNTFRDAFVDLLIARREANPMDFQEVPGARAMIERLLQDERFIVGIGTGGWEKPARLKLNHIGVDVNQLILSGADGHYSREAIVQEVLDNEVVKSADIQRVVYVGDAIWDVKTTRNMNLPLIGLRRKGDAHVLLDIGCSDVLADYLDQELFLDLVNTVSVPREV